MAYDRLFVGYGQAVDVLINLYIALCRKQFHRLLHPHHQLSGIASTLWKSVSEGVLLCRVSLPIFASQPAPAR
jgi:hypothetical protein